jgi:TetR/AcrR family transcriptional regulator
MSRLDASPSASSDAATELATEPASAATRKRPKPGERRIQILQALATMLQEPGTERVTTALLAARIGVSEAALYRHFASKAQMFEGLIEFIEQSLLTLVNQIQTREEDGQTQAKRIVAMVLQFAEKNPGMTRVMAGDALVFENQRLQERMNQLFDKLEASLRQGLKETAAPDAKLRASVATAFMQGRLQRHARSGFQRLPTEQLEGSLTLLLG